MSVGDVGLVRRIGVDSDGKTDPAVYVGHPIA